MKAQPTPTQTQAIAYLRVSTDEQKIGPHAQADLIIAFAQSHNLNLIASYLDHGVSGATPHLHRPALSSAINHALLLQPPRKRKVQPQGTNPPVVILVAKRDRLARDPLIAMTVERIIPVLSADNTANGQSPQDALMRSILDGMSQYERSLIRDRTKQALASLKQRGLKYSGSVPYGFKVIPGTNQISQDPAEVSVVLLSRFLANSGMSRRSIVKELEKRGFTARNGKPFHLTQVQRILARDSA